jgi:hypothetical protein
MNHTKYDRHDFNPNAKPTGDEMTVLELFCWLVAIGSFCGWLMYEFFGGAL